MDCIFCKIVNDEIPAAKVYEDEHVVAFLDIAPVHEGHTLIVPKEHYETVFDIPEHKAGHVWKVAKHVAHAVKDGLGCDGVNISQNNYGAAGQAVWHLHVHIIPRYENDGLQLWPQNHSYEEGGMEHTKEKIRKWLE